MEVYVYVDYRENKETGEIEFECPEVYGSFKDAQARYKKATSEISASITPRPYSQRTYTTMRKAPATFTRAGRRRELSTRR